MKLFNMNINKYMEADTGANGGAEGVAENVDNTQGNQGSEPEVKTFTQEQVNEMISKRLAKETEKHNKAMEDLKATYGKEKFEEGLTEAEKLAKMTAQEKKEYEFNKRVAEFEAKEKEYQLKELKAVGRDLLAENGFTGENAQALEGLVDYTNAETTKASIENLNKVINSLVEAKYQAKVNEIIKTPKVPDNIQSVDTKQAELNKLRKTMGLK